MKDDQTRVLYVQMCRAPAASYSRVQVLLLLCRTLVYKAILLKLEIEVYAVRVWAVRGGVESSNLDYAAVDVLLSTTSPTACCRLYIITSYILLYNIIYSVFVYITNQLVRVAHSSSRRMYLERTVKSCFDLYCCTCNEMSLLFVLSLVVGL